jgi:hypothetical protein
MVGKLRVVGKAIPPDCQRCQRPFVAEFLRNSGARRNNTHPYPAVKKRESVPPGPILNRTRFAHLGQLPS